jgi:hypothetical protein
MSAGRIRVGRRVDDDMFGTRWIEHKASRPQRPGSTARSIGTIGGEARKICTLGRNPGANVMRSLRANPPPDWHIQDAIHSGQLSAAAANSMPSGAFRSASHVFGSGPFPVTAGARTAPGRKIAACARRRRRGLLSDLAVLAHNASLCLAIRGGRLVGRTPVAVSPSAASLLSMRRVVLGVDGGFFRPVGQQRPGLALVGEELGANNCCQLAPGKAAKASAVEPPPQAMRRRAYLFGGVE